MESAPNENECLDNLMASTSLLPKKGETGFMFSIRQIDLSRAPLVSSCQAFADYIWLRDDTWMTLFISLLLSITFF